MRRAALADGSNPTTIATGSFDYVNVMPNSARLLMGTRGNSDAVSTDLDGQDATTIPLRTVSLMSTGATGGASVAQTVSWSPDTALTIAQSPYTPIGATTDGDGEITYSVVSDDGTGCQVDAATGELTFTAAGSCTVRATAAATTSFLTASTDATFHITLPADSTVELSLGFGQGDTVAGASVEVTATGLQPGSTVTVELHSTPIVLGTGTADSSGNFSMVVQLPAQIEPGAHAIIARATNAQGDPIDASMPLLVDWTGAYVDTQTGGGYHATTPTACSIPAAMTHSPRARSALSIRAAPSRRALPRWLPRSPSPSPPRLAMSPSSRATRRCRRRRR